MQTIQIIVPSACLRVDDSHLFLSVTQKKMCELCPYASSYNSLQSREQIQATVVQHQVWQESEKFREKSCMELLNKCQRLEVFTSQQGPAKK